LVKRIFLPSARLRVLVLLERRIIVAHAQLRLHLAINLTVPLLLQW